VAAARGSLEARPGRDSAIRTPALLGRVGQRGGHHLPFDKPKRLVDLL